jgi:hypothetical protein
LRPIHKILMTLLSKLPCDRTFTQNPFHNWTGKDPFYSLDLSSATDRFPAHLQHKLMVYLIDNVINNPLKSYKWAESWVKLLTDKLFSYKGNDYRYSVGQPMGTYSSWAAFTLTHHLVVQFCAYKNGCFPFINYIILGDDIVIKDNNIARSYISFMTKLGVEISPHKTHVSLRTYEFAKRWIQWSPDGKFIELSPIPLKGIGNNIDNPFIVYTILFDYFIVKGNLYLSRSSVISLVIRLYNNLIFKTYHKKKLVKTISFHNEYLRAKLLMLDLSMRFSLNLITDCKLREYLAITYKNQDWYFIPNESTILKTEVLRVLGISIWPAIQAGKDTISKLNKRFTQYWALSFNEPSKLDLFPLAHSIINWSRQTESFFKSLDLSNTDNNNELLLFNIYKSINFIDLNDILMWDRNYFSNVTCGGRLFSICRKSIKGQNLDNFEFIKGYLPDIPRDIDNFLYNFEQFGKYTKDLEMRNLKPLHPKQVEMFKALSKRHGYSYLI